jgi:hypothetical protein
MAIRKNILYEQGADINRIGEYVTRWVRWLEAGVEQVDHVWAAWPTLRDVMQQWSARPRQDAATGNPQVNVMLRLFSIFAAHGHQANQTEA